MRLLQTLYRIRIPLPKSPLRFLNSYVIKDSGRSLIIDTGMNVRECRDAMLSSLKRLRVSIENCDLFITHLHYDHMGLAANLAYSKSKIYFNAVEPAYLDFTRRWKQIGEYYRLNGFPDEIESAFPLRGHMGYDELQLIKFTFLRDSEQLSFGNFQFICMETPGHSPGHLCLYEPDKKLLIAGDHILSEITPNVTLWLWEMNPLERYLASLDKVYSLDVTLVLPGHGNIFSEHRKRINELKRHHEERCEEILAVLRVGQSNAYNLASRIKWDVDCDSFDLFPSNQKWFALGETLSHLKLLVEKGRVAFNPESYLFTIKS